VKVISYDTGRVTWLFPTEEFLPLGSGDGRAIIEQVAEKYEFSHPPQNPSREEVEKNGLKFGGGRFVFDGKLFVINEFVAYNDGIVAVAPATEPATAFLEDIVEFLKEAFQFRSPITPIKKVSVSNVIIEFDGPINSMLAEHEAFTNLISGYLNANEGTSFPAKLSRLDFTQDRGASEKPVSLPKWTLEARANVPISQNRYFSSAAIPTKQHLQMIQEIEAIFLKRTAGSH
jgi:hypothetical protein